MIGKVFYTPVKSPEKVEYIEIKENNDLKLINGFVEKIIDRKIKNYNPNLIFVKLK